MKMMTCKEIGGLCDTEMFATTFEEMLKKGQEHLETFHSKLADKMKKMTAEETKKWNDNFMKKWNNKPNM